MAFRDLRDFLHALKERGELREVRVSLDPVLEIAEVTARVSRSAGPALLFSRPRGFAVPVLTNLMGSPQRVKLAFGGDPEEKGEELFGILDPAKGGRGVFEAVKGLKRLRPFLSARPKKVKKGLCQEVVHREPNLEALPHLKGWPADASRFITAPLVITADPETGQRNVGMYRMQVLGPREVALHWHPGKGGFLHWKKAMERGQRLEVAVAIGVDPLTLWSSTAPLPEGLDELWLSGLLRQKAVEVVEGVTVPLHVPARAEVVIEGYILPGEEVPEGPFGDHTGFYSPQAPFPLMHVTAITHRRDPIYHAIVVGRPPMEDFYLGKATERFFLPLIKRVLPEVVDINMPPEGVFHNLLFVSIRKDFPGQARKVAHGLWGLGQMASTKIIVVFDDDVNVQDLSECLWVLGSNVDPERDVFIERGPLDLLDHASPEEGYGSKMGIDATKKLPAEGHRRPWPEAIRSDPEVAKRVDELWEELGL
ncbi:MAG: menaquinone biosynthesis decarboxylase [Deltaproteobacteria bacterium]|nr:MAG: menaquinone biosynthesis decarboxylase [Deltaproteobacteria bacterium]